MQKPERPAPVRTRPSPAQQSTVEARRAPLPAGMNDAPGGNPQAPLVAPYFDPQTVVSLDLLGQPLSRYGDRSWSLRSMSTDGGQTPCNLYFFEAWPLAAPPEIGRAYLAALIHEQQKALLWLHMDAGRQRAQKTILSANLTLTKLARGAHLRGVTLFDLFCDPQLLGEESANLNSSYAKHARALLKTLWRARDFLRIKVQVRVKELAGAIKQSAENERQTPLIPSRIYCAILGNLLGSLDQIERDLAVLMTAYRQERHITLHAPKELTERQHQSYREERLQDLNMAMRAHGWKNGSLRNFIAGRVSFIQRKLMNVVIAFTGMRFGEAQILPLKGVLEKVKHRGSVHHVINGFSHKLNGGRKKPANWVTSHEGHRAVVLAQIVASTILEVLKNGDPVSDGAALLFCTTNNPYRKKSTVDYKYMGDELITEICPLITQGDIDELNAMELERGWLREGIAVGKPWPLTLHQYRRSLSVYAHRSGMVSLPALKMQLQHITDELRAYYSDGFCRAVNLVFDKDHFSHEWNAAKSESSYLAYSLALLFSDEDLIGGIGGRGAARMQQVVSDRSKAETLKLFRDGKLAYHETPLGGCTAVESCDLTPLEPIPWDCLAKDCANAVVFGKRLSLVIKTQDTVVATLEKDERGSVEHRLEVDHLRVLLKARQRLTETV
jgi:hypothetical protein